jgi:hypothetical protein
MLTDANDDDTVAPNRRFYDVIWQSGRLASPEWFNTWPLLSRLARTATHRLEIGAGLHPRLPVEGSHFVDV